MAFTRKGETGHPPPSLIASGQATISAPHFRPRLNSFGDLNGEKQIFKLSFDKGGGLLIIAAHKKPEPTSHMNTTQTKRAEQLKTKVEAWKISGYRVEVSPFGEPYSNGAQPVRVTWSYGERGNPYLDGSALVLIGLRGSMRIFFAQEGLEVGRSATAATAKRMGVMTRLPVKLV